MQCISSAMPLGNGAHVIHKTLEENILNYKLASYSPWLTLFPPFLPSMNKDATLFHCSPDYAIFHLNKQIPFIATFHNYLLDPFMHNYSSILQRAHYKTDLRLFTRLALKKADCVTAVSHFTAQLIKADMQFEKDIKVIYNGIDESTFYPVNNPVKNNKSEIVVLFSGNLTQRKGAQWLIPIANKLNPNITIHYTSGLRSNKHLPAHPRLKCVGNVAFNKMPELYRSADILLFPTVREGFGLAAAEAMACGLPVVTTNCSSLPELVDDGLGGFLCPLGDASFFADKINQLAEDPALRNDIKQHNREKILQQFTLSKMISNYHNLFEEFSYK